MAVDTSKFKVLESCPAKFAYPCEPHGVMHFVKDALTDADCALLVANKFQHIQALPEKKGATAASSN
jgi:hypothetical protein